MLDADPPALREGARGVLGRQVGRVQVVGDVGRLEVEQPLQMRQVRLEGSVRQQVFEIAGVRSHVRSPAAHQREGVLQLRADRKEGLRSGDRKREWLRRVAAGPAYQAFAPVHDPRDRVVVAAPDLAVMRQERVGDRRQSLERLGIVRGERLVRQVAAGQNDGTAQPLQQQVVQRRVREEEPDAAVQGRRPCWLRRYHPVSERRFHSARPVAVAVAAPVARPAAAPLHEHDRSRWGDEQRLLLRRHFGLSTRRRKVPDHHRERLRPTMLAVAQPGDGHGIRRVAGEVVAAEALDSHDPPGAQIRKRGRQRRFPMRRRGSVAGTPVRQLWTAVGARDRLGVETAIRRVAIFGLARGAQPELAHRGPGAIVRKLIDDRCPRTAVGAVGERVAVASVVRVEQLAQAIVAGGDVGREQTLCRGDGLALLDRETGASRRRPLDRPNDDLLDPGARRRVSSKA